jgi:hypothetical protein
MKRDDDAWLELALTLVSAAMAVMAVVALLGLAWRLSRGH